MHIFKTKACSAGYKQGLAGNFEAKNPYSLWRPISWALWEDGHHKGKLVHLNTFLAKRNEKLRVL